MELRSLGRLVVIVSAALVSFASLAVASSPAGASTPAKKCAPGLASGISWDHSDPQYLAQIATVAWRNCKGAIRKVDVEWRSVDAQGGLDESRTLTYTADIDHKANGRQSFSKVRYLANGYQSVNEPVTFALKSCTTFANGRDATSAVTGRTWYLVTTAYDRTGKPILKRISPPVVCDQNG